MGLISSISQTLWKDWAVSSQYVEAYQLLNYQFLAHQVFISVDLSLVSSTFSRNSWGWLLLPSIISRSQLPIPPQLCLVINSLKKCLTSIYYVPRVPTLPRGTKGRYPMDSRTHNGLTEFQSHSPIVLGLLLTNSIRSLRSLSPPPLADVWALCWQTLPFHEVRVADPLCLWGESQAL